MVIRDSGRRQPQRRPDASMSLLNDLFAHPVDEDYADAAARRAAAGDDSSSGSKPRTSPAMAFGLLGLGLLLTIAVLQVQQDAGVVSAERTSLVEQVHAASNRTSELESVLTALEEDVVSMQTRALQSAADMEELRSSMTTTQIAAGTSRVSGAGIVVELDDAEPGAVVDPETDPSVLTVLDIDLQQVLNGLWAAGAEAVSINGERITPITAIRSVNDVILVNMRPVGAPYLVSAIGDPQTLAQDFSDGPGGTWLRYSASNFGIRFSIEYHESLTLPGGAASLQVARP